jgi:hypothetical protein
MVVSASIESCATADAAGISTSSVYFNKPYYLYENFQHSFEYTMMATDVDAACVVSLIAGVPKNLTDQNGLSNEPLEDISQYALSQWYTRRFNIDNATFAGGNRYLRVGITCTARTPIANNATIQTVLIRDIRFVSTSEYSPVTLVYNYKLCALGCELSTIDGALCMRTVDGSAAWMYPTNLTNPVVKTAAPLTVLGEVQTKELWLASSLEIAGCLTSMVSEGITVHLPPSRNITVNYQLGCFLPRFKYEIDINPQYSGVPISSPYSTSCLHRFYPEKVTVTMVPGRVTFYAGSDTVYEECHNDENAESNYKNRVALILAIVFSVVGAVGIFLGVFFGVRKYRQQKLQRQLTSVEVNME